MKTEINRVLRVPNSGDTLKAVGFEPIPMSAVKFGAATEADVQRFAQITQEQKIDFKDCRAFLAHLCPNPEPCGLGVGPGQAKVQAKRSTASLCVKHFWQGLTNLATI